MSFLTRSISRRAAAQRFLTAGVAGAAVAAKVEAAQPHMDTALRALRNAKVQLEMAEPDKEGHRVKAIELVNQAIAQVEAGIQAGAGR
jgi:hypothetical protein